MARVIKRVTVTRSAARTGSRSFPPAIIIIIATDVGCPVLPSPPRHVQWQLAQLYRRYRKRDLTPACFLPRPYQHGRHAFHSYPRRAAALVGLS